MKIIDYVDLRFLLYVAEPLNILAHGVPYGRLAARCAVVVCVHKTESIMRVGLRQREYSDIMLTMNTKSLAEDRADSSRIGLLTTPELADYLRVPVTRIHCWRQRNVGPRGVRVGGSLRFRRTDVEDWLRSRETSGSGAAIDRLLSADA